MRAVYDVIVVGGGPTGLCAAVQAARLGASTLLVEKCGMLGGTTTVAGVTYPALFWGHGRQVIAGIGFELVCRAVEEAGGSLPDPTAPKPKQNNYPVNVNGPLYAALADRFVLDSGAELLLHTMPAAVAWAGDGWSLTLCGKGGLKAIEARQLIDATGDANLVRLAGLPVERPDGLQPGTLVFRFGGYDASKLDLAAIERAFAAECEAGRLRRSDPGWSHGKIAGLVRSGGGNTIHVCGIDASDSEGKTAMETAGRGIMLDLYRFLRRQPGLENLRIEAMCGECGVRETVVIRGETTVTLDDYFTGRRWPDSVCHSFYPIDLHTDEGLDFREIPAGVVPTIPLGAMIPTEGRCLLAPGRHLASDRLANSALRVQSTCMATGQAAGAAAALSARLGLEPRTVPLDQLKHTLREHGAIVPE